MICDKKSNSKLFENSIIKKKLKIKIKKSKKFKLFNYLLFKTKF